jgi:glycogen debranching enzyme
LTLERTVEGGIHEVFSIANYTGKKISFTLEQALRSDFADLFEVKAKRLVQHGRMLTEWEKKEQRLRTTYDHKDFHRAITCAILNTEVPVGYANGRIFLEIELEPGQQWHTCCELILEHGHQVMAPASGHRAPEQLAEPLNDFDKRQTRWQARCTGIATPNNNLDRTYRQAVDDMGALRIYDMDLSNEAWVPAAGVPWFVTLFGRAQTPGRVPGDRTR